MLQILPSTLFILIILGGGLLSLCFWLAAHFYRQWQIWRFFDETQMYPNKQSRFETINDVKIHFTVEGDGPDILLIHGLAANIYTWRKLTPLLVAQNRRVWAVDLKGFGLSDKPRKSNYSLEAQADLLADFLKLNGVKKCLVVGNSMGGAVAVELGARHQELVSGLVLMNSVHDPKIFKIDVKVFSRFVQLLIPMVSLLSPLVNRDSVRYYIRNLYGPKYKITDDDLKAYLAPYMQGTSSNTVFMWALKGLMENSQVSKIRDLRLPILIIWGAYDKIVPVRFGLALHEALKDSRLQIHKDAGHHVQEEDPHWVAERIFDFDKQHHAQVSD